MKKYIKILATTLIMVLTITFSASAADIYSMVNLTNFKGAYLFGYLPVTGADGSETIYMGPDNTINREEVTTIIRRIGDQAMQQTNAKQDGPFGDWYGRGFNWFLQMDPQFKAELGPITRAEIAHLIRVGFLINIKNGRPDEDVYIDVSKDNPYYEDIYILQWYSYLNGVGNNTFEPDRYMTRGEFTALVNRILQRNKCKLIDVNGNTVTPETYHIADLDGHWAKTDMLLATSAFNKKNIIDLSKRLSREELDHYSKD